MRVCSEIKNKMQVEIDQFGKPFFKADELLDASQIKCLLTSIEQKNWTIECEICQKKFSSKRNLASHTKINHSHYENEITAKSKEYVREIFDAITFKGTFFSEGVGAMSKRQTYKPKIFLNLEMVIFLYLSNQSNYT